jgi:hypothetical protein
VPQEEVRQSVKWLVGPLHLKENKVDVNVLWSCMVAQRGNEAYFNRFATDKPFISFTRVSVMLDFCSQILKSLKITQDFSYSRKWLGYLNSSL